MGVRPTIATIDLDAIRHNLRVVQRIAPEQAVCAIVKADAYGHGQVKVAQTLENAGADWLAVALVEEGVVLRDAGIEAPILVLGGAVEGGFELMIEKALVPALFRREHLEALAAAAAPKDVEFHLKIDTGMARLGVTFEELDGVVDTVEAHSNLKLDGLLTHFANADLADREFNTKQLDRFNQAREKLAGRGIEPRWIHLSNSAGVLSFPESHVGLLRPGLMLYGLDPRASVRADDLRPAMSWTTRPVHIKTVAAGTRVSYGGHWVAPCESRIATLPVGYADGYPRSLGNKAHVLICGKPAPIRGVVCMDLCMVDVTEIPEAKLGDPVVLIGRQGEEEVSAYDLASWAGTIPYEITCGVGGRVPRTYLDSTP